MVFDQAKKQLFDMVRLMGKLPAGATLEDCEWDGLIGEVESAFSALTKALQAERQRTTLAMYGPKPPCCHIEAERRAQAERLRVRFPNASVVVELIRYDFDNMENDDALRMESVGFFGADASAGLSAHGKIAEYLKNRHFEKFYTGWDGRVYPRYELHEVFIR